jgi:hypothetical protein
MILNICTKDIFIVKILYLVCFSKSLKLIIIFILINGHNLKFYYKLFIKHIYVLIMIFLNFINLT